jgi:flavin-dependent dehydrogenase
MQKEIKILGAGPSGLVAAINLAKAGYKVSVFEKNSDCGLRFNGDFQGLENWTQKIDILDELRLMNININFHCQAIYNMNFYDYKLNKKDFFSERPMAYLVRRGALSETLDYCLKQQAIEVGVSIIFNKKINDDEADIIAKGPTSADVIAKGITFETDMADSVIVFLDDEIAPKGYAYLLISRGNGCLVTVLFKHIKKEKEYYERMRDKVAKAIRLDIRNEKEFGGFGNFFLGQKYLYANKLYIGEGAGLQDFLAGFGMRYAMVSGYLAAKSIIENKDYNEFINERFGGQLKAGVSNRFLFEKLGNRGYQLLIKYARKNPINFLYDHYNQKWYQKIIFPLAKLSMNSKEDMHKDCNCYFCRSKEQEQN